MRKLTLLTLSLAAFAAANAQQTTDSKTQTVTIDIKSRIDVTVTAGPTLTFANAADFTGPVNTEATPSTITVNSNKAFDLKVKAQTADFVPRGTSTTTMAASVLEWKKAGGSYAAMSTTDANVAVAAAKGTQTYSISYKANVGYSYDPDIYDLVVVYTATQN